jgi:glutathione reductase (NADPH)
VESIEKTGAEFLVHSVRDNDRQTVACDLVVHAAGRVPDLEDLDLAAGGIETEKGRLKLTEFLQSTSNGQVFAAGDAAANGPPLTPVSSHDAKVVAANLLEGNRHRPDYRGVPSVAFTIPPIAAVGASEADARKQGRNVRMKAHNASGWFTARRLAESVYGFKVLVDADTDQVLGAHLVGPHVDQTINLFGLAIRHNLTAAQLKSTIFAYPTGASDIASMV